MTIEKIKQLAAEKYGKNLTDAQAKDYAAKYGRLSDNELDSVAGGGCGEQEYVTDKDCPDCDKKLYISDSGMYIEYVCHGCGYQSRR